MTVEELRAKYVGKLARSLTDGAWPPYGLKGIIKTFSTFGEVYPEIHSGDLANDRILVKVDDDWRWWNDYGATWEVYGD